MEIQVPNGRECSNPKPQPTSPSKASSPSSSSSSSTSASACANNGVLVPSLNLRPLPRPIETAPSTTFVQADPSSFKQVVQMLTGSPSSSAPPPTTTTTTSAARSAVAPKKPSFKLYERRGGGGLKSLKTIGPLSSPALRSPNPNPNPNPNPSSPWGQGDVPSPSVLGFRSLALSPVTPLSPDGVFNRSPCPGPPDSFAAAAAAAAEERAIAEKGFYFHPSPRGDGAAEPPPCLLPLFPVTSPKLSSSP